MWPSLLLPASLDDEPWEGKSLLLRPKAYLRKPPPPAAPQVFATHSRTSYPVLHSPSMCGWPAPHGTARGSECTQGDKGAGERKTGPQDRRPARGLGAPMQPQGRGSEGPQRSWNWSSEFYLCLCFKRAMTMLYMRTGMVCTLQILRGDLSALLVRQYTQL